MSKCDYLPFWTSLRVGMGLAVVQFGRQSSEIYERDEA